VLFRIIFGTLSFPITIAVTIKKTSFHTEGSKRPHRCCPLRIANWGQNIDHEHTFVPYLWPTMAFVLGRGAFSHGGVFRADTVVRHCGSSVRGRAGVLSSGNAERLTPARPLTMQRSLDDREITTGGVAVVTGQLGVAWRWKVGCAAERTVWPHSLNQNAQNISRLSILKVEIRPKFLID